MTDDEIKETQAKAIETMKQMEQVLAEANAALAKSAELHERAGLHPDAYMTYLRDERGPVAEKKKELADLEQWKTDIDREVSEAVAASKETPRSGGPAGAGWARV